MLVTEGTYPFARGGVSVWCDQLVNGLPEWSFRVVALTGFGYQRPVYDLPPHAADLTTVGLWDTHRHRRRWRDWRQLRSRRRRQRPAAQPAQTLAELLAASDDDVAGFRRFLDGVASLRPEEIGRQLGFGELLAALDAELRSPRWAPTAGVRAADLVQVAEILDHMLRPLAVEVGPAPIYHATSNGLSALVCMVAERRHGGRFLLSEHGIYLRERYIELRRSAIARPAKALLLRFHRLVSGAAYEEASVIAPCNQWNQRWEARHGATAPQLRTIYNGIDPSRFPARGDEPPEPVVAWLGRIDPIKDLETLIRAFEVVHAKRPDARLRLYGPTPPGNEDYRASLDRLVAELRLGGVVTFEGGVDRPTEAYGDAQIAVLSSISEGFPYSLIEAMACELPTVATAVGGNHEAMGDTGIVVTPRAPDLLAAAVIELLDDGPRRRRLGVRARERVLRQFTVATCLDRYRSLYRELCSTHMACVAHAAHAATCPQTWGSGPLSGGENGNGSPGSRPELDAAEVDALLAAVGGPAAVEAAVDVDEVAAAFESVGMTDQVAAERFGSPDVFDLAERAREEAGARHDPGTPRHRPRDRPAVTLPSARGAVGRGVSYALPALVLAAASVSGVSQGAVIAASALGWGLAQGGGVLAFTVLHRTGSPRSLAPLRRALTATVAAVLVAGTGVGAVTSAAVGAAFALPLLHLVGSAALVTAERARPALAAMAPVSLLSVAALVRPQSPAVTLVAPVSAGTVAAILILVALAARGPRPRARTLEPVDLIRSLPLVGCGWLAAAFALLAVSTVSDVSGLGGVDNRQWLVLGLPLWLMVVTGEWLLIRMRRSLRALLEASPSVSVFRRAGRWSVVRWLEVAVLGLQGAVWAAAALSTLSPDAAWRAASIFFLVAATLVGVTVLTVASRVGVATGVLGVTVAALACVTATSANPFAVTDHSAALAVSAVAALALAVAAVRALADPASHR